nr:hypothetical protein 49p1_00276 [Yersinia frederiksenii]
MMSECVTGVLTELPPLSTPVTTKPHQKVYFTPSITAVSLYP